MNAYINNSVDVNYQQQLAKFNIRSIIDEQQYISEIAAICQQFETDKRWILMLNPNEKSLEQLACYQHINTTRILKVNGSKHRISRLAIEKALSIGNCAAIVIYAEDMSSDDLADLQYHASKSSTQCIILEHRRNLH